MLFMGISGEFIFFLSGGMSIESEANSAEIKLNL